LFSYSLAILTTTSDFVFEMSNLQSPSIALPSYHPKRLLGDSWWWRFTGIGA
jgi:hypothetical protein